MDSKFRRMAFLSVILMFLMVGTVVFLSNRSQINRQLGVTGQVSGSSATVETVNQGGEPDSAAAQGTSDETATVAGTFRSGFAGADPAKQKGKSLTAFLSDASFFNQEKTDLEKEMDAEKKNQLYFVATSVERDLRVQVVDHDNNAVTGIPFVIQLKDTGSYKDTDEDGMIYIGDLKAGNYALSMGEVKGYTVPEPTTVSVKDKVEYAEIPDISLLIKTEADIVAQEDDLEIKNATEDTDNSEITGLQNLNGNGVLGVDVSKYNGDIDWNKVRDAGISFAVIRAGYRGATSGSLVVDPKFEQNMQGALDAGLDVGVYFFTQAVNEVEAVEEASAVLELCKDYRLKYPVFIDSEGAGGNGRADALDTQERTKVCEAFCKTIENAGQTAGVYASKNWYQGRLDAQTLESHTIWLAEYRGVPKYEGYYQLWQYTSKGQVDGITGNVDLNVSYLTQ